MIQRPTQENGVTLPGDDQHRLGQLSEAVSPGDGGKSRSGRVFCRDLWHRVSCQGDLLGLGGSEMEVRMAHHMQGVLVNGYDGAGGDVTLPLPTPFRPELWEGAAAPPLILHGVFIL